MTISTVISNSELLSNLNNDQKLEFLLRRTEAVNASKLLKDKGLITRHKSILTPEQYMGEKYDKLVYKMYSIALSKFITSLNSQDNHQFRAEFRKTRNRKRAEISLEFPSNEIAVSFSNRMQDLNLPGTWNRPLVYYRSTRAIFHMDYSSGSFYPSSFFSIDREHRDQMAFSRLFDQLDSIFDLCNQVLEPPSNLPSGSESEPVSERT